MKKLQVGIFTTFSVSFLLSSFIYGPNILNGSNLYKQFGVELGIVAFACLGILLLLMNRGSVNFRFTKCDTIIIVLSIYYCVFNNLYDSPPLVKSLLFYYVLFYFFLKLEYVNIEMAYLEGSFKLLLTVVPFVILVHVIIFIFQNYQLSILANGNNYRGSTFGNPDMLGSYLSVLMPFCLIQLRPFKIFGIAIYLLSLLLLVLLQARTSLVAQLGCGLMWILLNLRNKLMVNLIITSLSICLIFLLFIWHPESVLGRFFIWLVSVKMITLKPFGWGLFAFDRDFPLLQASVIPEAESMMKLFTPEVVHSSFNELLNVGVTMGVIPLILFLVLCHIIFINLLKMKYIIVYPILAFFVISLTYFPFKIAPIIVIIIPLIAYISHKEPKCLHLKLSGVYGTLLLLFMFSASLALAVKTIHATKTFNRWQYCYSIMSSVDSNLELEHLFVQLYPELRNEGRFLITYSNYLQGIGKTNESLELLEEATYYFSDITLYLQLAHLYEHLGFVTLAEEKYNVAISLAPTKLKAAYEKVLFLHRTGQLNDAYNAILEILSRPVESSVFADNYIIISHLKKLKRHIEWEFAN